MVEPMDMNSLNRLWEGLHKGNDQLPAEEEFNPQFSPDIGDAIETLIIGADLVPGDIGYARGDKPDEFIAEYYRHTPDDKWEVAFQRKYRIVEVTE